MSRSSRAEQSTDTSPTDRTRDSGRPPADRTRDSGRPSIVDVSNLSYTYPGADEPALEQIDFTIERGEIFGFLGPSGAGKSTTQQVLVGLLDSYDGDISVFGEPLSDWGGDYYERIGISYESPNQYRKLTGRENLELFGSLYSGDTRDAAALLELVGLADAADQRVSGYSKGMRMRLNFVRSLLHDPDLVFLDEPTTGLDPTNARNIREIVRGLRDEGKTVFLTTHDMAVADDLCDRVAFIIDGQIPVIDAPETLKKEHGSPQVRVEYERDGTHREEVFDLSTLGEDDQFQSLLSSSTIERMHSEEATLEDVFIDVTGSELQ